jgi:hypothetical protein
MVRRAFLVALIGLTFLAGEVLAKKIIPEKEWRQGDNAKVLPTFCQDRLDPKGRWLRWKSYFGSVSIHIHHYCGGLYAEFKAKTAPTKKERDQWLRFVVGEMSYVADNCGSTCVIYADVHRRLASALTQQGKYDAAMEHIRLISAMPSPAAPQRDVRPPAERPGGAPPS